MMMQSPAVADDGCANGRATGSKKMVMLLSTVVLVVLLTSTTTTATKKALANGSNHVRKLFFAICDPDACSIPNCNAETQVAYQPEGACCGGCLDVRDISCTTCPGGFTKLLSDGTTCQDCSCFGASESCTNVDDATACEEPTCTPAEGVIVAPLRQQQPQPEAFDCSDCVGSEGYFDGCNVCTCSEGEEGTGACSRMDCGPVAELPYCIDNLEAQSSRSSEVDLGRKIDFGQKIGTIDAGIFTGEGEDTQSEENGGSG